MIPIWLAMVALEGLKTAYNGWQMGQTQKRNNIRSADALRVSRGMILDPNQAMTSAGGMLNPYWNQQIEANMGQFNNDLINRGFYGQQPGDQLSLQARAALEGQRAQAVSNLAQQLYQQSIQNAQGYYGMATGQNEGDMQFAQMQAQNVNNLNFKPALDYKQNYGDQSFGQAFTNKGLGTQQVTQAGNSLQTTMKNRDPISTTVSPTMTTRSVMFQPQGTAQPTMTPAPYTIPQNAFNPWTKNKTVNSPW